MNRTVLIVDDDANAQIVAETLLGLRGLRVCVATDGAGACDLVQRGDIGVIIVELSLLKTSDVLHAIRRRFGASPATDPPRIVVVTDRTEPEVERFARRLGADAFHRKPIAWGRFIDTVEEFLDGAAPEAA